MDVNGDVELEQLGIVMYLASSDIEAMMEELEDRMPDPGDTKIGWRK